MIISPSAPSSSASRLYRTAFGVCAFMVPTSTWHRPATCLTVSSTSRVRSSSDTARNSPVVPRTITPGTRFASCQSRNRRHAGTSTALPSPVKGVIVTA
jgi:hypothetical protein